mmetsp:Transcript_62176/g.140248  ORF Transcript_62176/g.140248 Transcript_62176/m.140248 type:complete len:217 (-) Transcript_62176:76-726(-)
MPDSSAAAFPDEEEPETVEDLAVEEVRAARIREGHCLFEMLDRDRDGALGRRDARSWLRSLGWCLPDAELDSLLDQAPSAPSPQRGNLGGNSPSRRGCSWSLPGLLCLADKQRELCGPDPEALLRALRLLAGGRGASTARERMRQLATGHEEGLSDADFEELLELCGVAATARSIDVEAMHAAIVDTVCQPRCSSAVKGPAAAAPTHRGARVGGFA